MRNLKNQTGSFIIWLTLAFALLGTFIGFALDFGRAYLEKARVARLVDAAALAAAKVLKGQPALENAARRAACDSMSMNGVSMETTGNTCVATEGAYIQANIEFFDLPVAGGPPVRAVRVTATEPVSTTFLRFLGWMAPGDYSNINVVARAEAGPERPIDLMLVLDRSGSMNDEDGRRQRKINALKTAVNGFLGLSNAFSVNDRIGMTSFAYRGCGNSSGRDSTATTCAPDAAMNFATSTHINNLQGKIDALDAEGGTNTMEALRTARGPIAAAFNDSTRVTSRKAVLLVTDGQPTFMRLNSTSACQSNPKSGTTLPPPGDSGGAAEGCLFGVNRWDNRNSTPYSVRMNLALTTTTRIPASPQTSADLYRDVIRCTRALSGNSTTGCVNAGAMEEANIIRNCGVNNAACAEGGAEHDVVFFAIAIGEDTSTTNPQGSLDSNAKCLLARMANATDILHARTGVTESLATVCNNVFTTTLDGDTHQDLAGREKGRVYIVDLRGDVTQQLTQIFNEIAAILKLRLVL